MSNAGESSKRSDIIDITYGNLHEILTQQDGVHLDQIKSYLEPRKEQFRRVTDVFGKPSAASRKKIESGSVPLPDGEVVQVDDGQKECVFAVSDKFQIDEVQACILVRAFIFSHGLSGTSSGSLEAIAAELAENITPFYDAERLHTFRVLIPLFYVMGNSDHRLHEFALEFVPRVLPDGTKFAEEIVAEYIRKTKEVLPSKLTGDPKKASQWAKQSLKDQLVLLEVLFWAMFNYVQCTGPLVVTIYEAAYGTCLGSTQANNTLLLDEESRQMQQDCAAIWILITTEILELESLSDPQFLDFSEDTDNYTSSPTSLQRIHELVTTHGDSQYCCTYLAWTYVLSRLHSKAEEIKELPPTYQTFFDAISQRQNREPLHVQMAKTCLEPEAGLFNLLGNLLTNSPLFVTAVSWRTGSSISDPNAVAFRSVLKGFIMAIVELVPVELIPEFDALVEVWIALFGRSESSSVSGICRQFWEADFRTGIARRAILDVARQRFPIQVKPLTRLLRAMTGSGFLDTDSLSTADSSHEGEGLSEERKDCDTCVFHYLYKLPTFSQVLPLSACAGAHAIYERQPERYGSSKTNSGPTYSNLRPIRLPGGSVLPAKSTGKVLSGDGADHVVVCWQHEHSGWKVILEILTDYVNRKRMDYGSGGTYRDVSFGRRGSAQIMTLQIGDIGMERDSHGDEDMITDVLDLVRSVIRDNPQQAAELMFSLEDGEPVVAHTMTESQPPDLVQLTTMILEEALSRSNGGAKSPSRIKLITSAISVLSALLAIPNYSGRVWLYIRSTTTLFGSDKVHGFASAALTTERATGQYTMTLALLHLVQQLFREASTSIVPDNVRLQQVKEEVLLRAARFVHIEIWIEHLGWKYNQLGDRFEIGKRVTSFYLEVLEHAPLLFEERPFATLSQSVADALLFKATTSTINPLVSSVSSGAHVLRMLAAARRQGDISRLVLLLAYHLHLCRLILTYKLRTDMASKPCLLEQALCARVTSGPTTEQGQMKHDPINVLASYVSDRTVHTILPVEAIRLLTALGASLSCASPSAPTIVGHLANPETTVALFVRIISHPYDELALRNGIWNFISLAVDKEPALSGLFVTGKFRAPSDVKALEAKGDDKKAGDEEMYVPTSALEAARDMLLTWRELWEANPQLLASVFRFLNVVWEHAFEHMAVLQPLRSDADFWDQIVSAACTEVGPAPDYEINESTVFDEAARSNHHEAIAMHAYRTLVRSFALRIVSLDIGIHIQLNGSEPSTKKPESYLRILPQLKSQDELTELLAEASPSSFAPQLHDSITEHMKRHFPGLTLQQLELQEPVTEREYGDSFVFSPTLLRSRLHAYPRDDGMDEPGDLVEKELLSINLNLSLAHSQTALAEAWETLLRRVTAYLRSDDTVRSILLSIAATLSYDIAAEQRSGDMMATIHGTRLSLLLSILELAWFSSTDKAKEVQSFLEVVQNLRGIITNEAQSPARSFLGQFPIPFHRALLQIIYFVTKQSRSLIGRPKAVNATQRVNVTITVEATLTMVIDALRVVFIAARSRKDVDLDRDMELLVSVFEQCTRADLSSSSAFWLARCQETDVIRASLDLYVHIDLVGLLDLPLLLSRKQPLYSPHILLFHMALVSNATAAERFASEGVLAAYSNNFISAAISSGQINVTLPELPTERSPAHVAYCAMISVVAAVISALGRHNHYFDSEACGFVQLYGDQISRALSWTIGDTITLPLVEEIEQVVNLFYAIAASVPAAANVNPAVNKVLRVFTTHALQLIQQLNYAITHPNHLTSLFEPVTNDERTLFEKAPPSGGDPLKRPLVAHLIHRLFRLSSNIIGTLVCISRADTVLATSQEDWPIGEALTVPHSKIVVGEPASLGTLLELGNCTLDVLRDLVNRPAGQSISRTPSLPGTYSTPLDVRQGVITARRNLEGVLLYSVTQLAMWLSKPEFETTSVGNAEAEEPRGHNHNHGMMDVQKADAPMGAKERHRAGAGRPGISMAERLRRGMTGEMAGDLQSLLNKSKAVIARSATVLGKEPVDVTQILLNFLQERVSAPS